MFIAVLFIVAKYWEAIIFSNSRMIIIENDVGAYRTMERSFWYSWEKIQNLKSYTQQVPVVVQWK